MNWKEEIIKFCVCAIIISLSLWSLNHTISKYYIPNEYISGGIVINKIHYEARTDTTFTTDVNGFSVPYTTYYPDEYLIIITKGGNDNTVTVDKVEYDGCEIGEYYSRK